MVPFRFVGLEAASPRVKGPFRGSDGPSETGEKEIVPLGGSRAPQEGCPDRKLYLDVPIASIKGHNPRK